MEVATNRGLGSIQSNATREPALRQLPDLRDDELVKLEYSPASILAMDASR